MNIAIKIISDLLHAFNSLCESYVCEFVNEIFKGTVL